MSDSRLLLISENPALVDEVVRISAVAGAEVEVAANDSAIRRGWRTAPFVLIDREQVSAVRRRQLAIRDGVVLVMFGAPDPADWEYAASVSARHIATLPTDEAWLVDQIGAAADGRTAAPIVAVTGGRGGAGATTLASALAVSARRLGQRALLIDADPLGGGIDLMLGAETAVGARWPELARTRGRLSAQALQQALPTVDSLTVLSFGRDDAASVPPDAVRSVLAAGSRGHDIVVVDLPRQLDDAACAVLHASTVALVVVPSEVRATAAAARVVPNLARHCDDVRLVVRGPAPGGVVAGDVARVLDVPLAGELRAEPGLAGALERGEAPARRGRGPLAEFCRDFLSSLLTPSVAA